jgi:hypothetical protein
MGKNSKVKILIFYFYSDVGSTEKNWKEHSFKRYNLYTSKDKLFVKKCQERQKVRQFISDPNSEKETRLKMEMEGKMKFVSRKKQRRPCCDMSVSPGLLYTVMTTRPVDLQPEVLLRAKCAEG